MCDLSGPPGLVAFAYGTELLGFWQISLGGGLSPVVQPWLNAEPPVATSGPLSE